LPILGPPLAELLDNAGFDTQRSPLLGKPLQLGVRDTLDFDGHVPAPLPPVVNVRVRRWLLRHAHTAKKISAQDRPARRFVAT
jgi:hypothetical protein